MSKIFGAAMMALALAFVSASSRAETPGNYPFNLYKYSPRALVTLQRIIPAKFKSISWIYKLDGTSDEMATVQIQGKPYRIGWVCKPHDCGENQLAFLIALDASRAMALMVSREATGGKQLWLGSPTSEEMAVLTKRINP
jgi:Inhibitor of vertebrate lysozyme (Ivy)